MYVHYRPEDGDSQTWEFIPGRVRVNEGELIEKRFGGTYDEFIAAVQSGSLRARRVLLWHLIRKTHHTLHFEATPDFYADELEVQHTREELEELQRMAEKASMPDEDKTRVMASLDFAMQDAPAGSTGKARSKNDESATG
jgi:hypothetical protein